MSMSAIVTFGIGLLILTSKPVEWDLPSLKELITPRDPVLVLLVGSTDGVARVRAAIDDDRVVAEMDGAFALRSKRVVAASPEAAGGPINQMGWVDKEIELIAVPMGQGLVWETNRHKNQDEPAGKPVDKAQAERIAALMSKATLTSAEAIAVMKHMDKTGQF